MEDSAAVFLIDDEPVVRRGSEHALRLADITVRSFGDAEAALAALADPGTAPPCAFVCDIRLPGIDGMTLLKTLQVRDAELPVILITGHGDVSLAVQAMRAGAYDFLEKPFSSDRLVDVVRRALEKRALVSENRHLREALLSGGEAPLLGESAAMQGVRRLVAALAPAGVDILINGETGAGKEVVARAIHHASGRSGPFVAVNCGALPESVFESEIFGHEAGAFTGASKRRITPTNREIDCPSCAANSGTGLGVSSSNRGRLMAGNLSKIGELFLAPLPSKRIAPSDFCRTGRGKLEMTCMGERAIGGYSLRILSRSAP